VKPYGIHWFRRDLRIAGNVALRKNFERHQGRVLGLFCFDSVFLKREDFSHNRFAFFLKTLKALKEEMQNQGGDLLVVDRIPQKFFKFFSANEKQHNISPGVVSFGRDYEPFARKRDEEVSGFLLSKGVEVLTERDHLILEPHEVLKGDGNFYQVFTPYSKKWNEVFHSPEVKKRMLLQSVKPYLKNSAKSGDVFKMKWKDLKLDFKDALNDFETENNKHVTIDLPEAGFAAGYDQATDFKSRMKDYGSERDIPSLDGTSKLSVYFKNGSLTPAQALEILDLQKGTVHLKNGPSTFLKEVVWREFYYSILWHRPDVEKTSFLPQYKDLNWSDNKAWFKRWCEGTTGFPIVDAGMRQLNQTGWMHNRVRMIVASFLVKDLLINWQWGENYFMKMLLDGDLAPNNGGWQWAASTGCDPQPYFRIFNPWLQAAKFDPDAEYIKTYIPELKNLTAKEIHTPGGREAVKYYPRPIIDHKTQSAKAIAVYKSARS
jgi:deoxyribodipyrimidine photo-lyase